MASMQIEEIKHISTESRIRKRSRKEFENEINPLIDLLIDPLINPSMSLPNLMVDFDSSMGGWKQQKESNGPRISSTRYTIQEWNENRKIFTESDIINILYGSQSARLSLNHILSDAKQEWVQFTISELKTYTIRVTSCESFPSGDQTWRIMLNTNYGIYSMESTCYIVCLTTNKNNKITYCNIIK